MHASCEKFTYNPHCIADLYLSNLLLSVQYTKHSQIFVYQHNV